MSQLARSTLRVAVVPVLGILGVVCAVMWPQAHAAFCTGLQSTVI